MKILFILSLLFVAGCDTPEPCPDRHPKWLVEEAFKAGQINVICLSALKRNTDWYIKNIDMCNKYSDFDSWYYRRYDK